jgi:hypothetical protein
MRNLYRYTPAKLEELEHKKRRVLAALVRLRAGRVFNAYVRLWAVAQLARLWADGAMHADASYADTQQTSSSSWGGSSSSRWGYIQVGFCAASLIAPWRTRVIVAGRAATFHITLQ